MALEAVLLSKESTLDRMLEFFESIKEDKGKQTGEILEATKGLTLMATATPTGDEIDALSKLNPKTPVYFSVLLGFETRVNELAGIVKVLDEPLYRPMHFFSDMVLKYMQIAPSTGKSEKNRAEAVLDTLKGPPLVTYPPMGARIPEPIAMEGPDHKGQSIWDKIRNKEE